MSSLVLFRFPHPVTLAGMLEMGTAYLPVNHNWKKYIDQSQAKFDELQQEVNTMLCRLAENARSLLEGERFVLLMQTRCHLNGCVSVLSVTVATNLCSSLSVPEQTSRNYNLMDCMVSHFH